EGGDTATYTVQLATQPTDAVTVTVSGMASGVTVDTDSTVDGEQTTLSFSTSNWNTAQPVTVSADEDDNNIDEKVRLTHTAAGADYDSVTTKLEVSVTDNDPRLVLSTSALPVDEASTATYTVKLAAQPTMAVTVNVSGMASAVTVAPASLSFSTSNWDTVQTVTVSGVEDENTSDEKVRLTHTASVDYGSVTAELVVTVTDTTPRLVLSTSALPVDEADTATYTVQLANQPTDAVNVNVSGMASAVTVAPTSLSFSTSNWNTARTVTVSGVEDDNNSDEKVTVTNTVAVDYGSVTAELVVTVTDNDPRLTLSPSALRMDEADTATYTVQLATQPTDGVTVTVSGMGSDVTVDPVSLNFSTSNWNTARTVTVSAAEDDNTSNESMTLTHTADGADYGSVTAELMVSVIDAQENICKRLNALSADGTVCDLYNKGITSLSVDDFNGLSNLRELDLTNNRLGSLPADVFNRLSNLRRLNLTATRLNWQPLPADVFDGLSNLRRLDLPNNNLTSLPEDIFAGLSNIQILVLEANKLSSLPKDIFAGLPKLKYLYLGYNYHLTCLPPIPERVSVHPWWRYLPQCDYSHRLVFSPAALPVGEADTATYTMKLAAQPTDAVTVTVSGMTSDVTVVPASLSFSTSNW
ncbi:MAG: hypothetical protein TH68_08165, partial [Candidatus Synechococcus spongiarum 142]